MEVKELSERFPILMGEGEETVEKIAEECSVVRGRVRNEHGSDASIMPFMMAGEETRKEYLRKAAELYPEFDEPVRRQIAEHLFYEKMKEKMAEMGINLSSEFSVLIKEAALCDSYASDILIDIASILDILRERKDVERTFYFGFRKMGVDHDEFLCRRIGDGTDREIASEYRSVYRLDIEHKYGDIRTVFAKVWDRTLCGGEA